MTRIHFSQGNGIVFILAMWMLPSCKKDKAFPDGTPTCIQERVVASPTVVVQEYSFEGSLVYRSKSSTGCADCPTVVLGKDCGIICTTGGFTGPMNPEVYERFLANGVLIRQIWPL
jgi:hypothetical protein